MAKEFNHKRIAVLATNGVEEITLMQPIQILKEAGAQVDIISPEEKFKTRRTNEWGDEISAVESVNRINPNNYDALLLPDGMESGEQLRKHMQSVNFVRHFLQDGKPVAAIGYGTGLLIETGLLRGRKVTAASSLRTDMEKAGGEWSEEAVIADRGILTCRSSDDLSAFMQQFIEQMKQGTNTASLGVAAQGTLPGEGAEIPNRGQAFRRG